MTRHRYIWDKDLEKLVEIGNGANRPEPEKRVRDHRVMSDIEPYRTAASDIAHDNKRIVVGSRSEHRRFLRDNGLIEIGNSSYPARPDPTPSLHEVAMDVKRAMGE